jgi:AraC family transcriptional activator of tynA and feaB
MSSAQPELKTSQSERLFREMLSVIDSSITDPRMSPQTVASALLITPRYVHKLFARHGQTFNSYVIELRLKHISTELFRTAKSGERISVLARRWGFTEISTFNRSFKLRFGCSPTQCRRNMQLSSWHDERRPS